MNQLINATIEIVEMSDKRGQYGLIKKIKGKNIETGQTNTYTVYDKKKDGSISAAWSQLQDIQVGETVSVGYAEQQGQMQDGTPFTSRIVRNFDKDLGNGRKNYTQHNPAPQTETPRTGQNNASSGLSQAEFSRRLGIQGHLNALLSNPSIYPHINNYPHTYYPIIEIAIEIEDELEKQLNPSPVRKALEKTNPNFFKQELPTILQDNPTDGALNPMVNDEPPIESYDDGFDPAT